MWNMFICCSGLSSILKSQGCQSFTTSDISEHAASESVYVGVCACRLFYCKCCVPEILFFTLVFCVRNCVWTCMWGFDVVKITVSLSAHTWQLTCCGWHDIPLTPGCCGRLPWFWDFREFLRVPRRPEGFLLVSACAWGPETLCHRDDPGPGCHSGHRICQGTSGPRGVLESLGTRRPQDEMRRTCQE